MVVLFSNNENYPKAKEKTKSNKSEEGCQQHIIHPTRCDSCFGQGLSKRPCHSVGALGARVYCVIHGAENPHIELHRISVSDCYGGS